MIFVYSYINIFDVLFLPGMLDRYSGELLGTFRYVPSNLQLIRVRLCEST